jgi:D-amino-acid oxidase
MMTPLRPDVLVVGAGVSGLTTAVRLAEDRSRPRVRVITESLPDRSTSAAAGAIWEPLYANHPRVHEWSARSYEVFKRMDDEKGPGVRLVAGVEASRVPMEVPLWPRELPGFRIAEAESLPPGFVCGWWYTAPVIDMPAYLRWLERRLAAAGGEVELRRVDSLAEELSRAGTVVNCSGTGATELVPDPSVQPIRGQLVAVRNPGVTRFFAEHTDELDEMTYMLPQGDVLLLGGNADKGERDRTPDPEVARAIVARCAEIVPAIATAQFLEHRVGIRPYRPEVRVEAEGRIVHNYGHGGAGVSLSWGCADAVAELVLG